MASKLGNGFSEPTPKNEYREGDNRYMAPETLQGVFTSRADIFSLGMTVLCVICDIELPKNGEMWHKVTNIQYFRTQDFCANFWPKNSEISPKKWATYGLINQSRKILYIQKLHF